PSLTPRALPLFPYTTLFRSGWYGDDRTTPLILAPMAFAFGGVAQFLAGMWSYRARDALATGIHGAWGSFWIAYGIYQLFVGLGGDRKSTRLNSSHDQSSYAV